MKTDEIMKNVNQPKSMVVSFKDFKKLDIRVGEIVSAEKIPETDKLIRLIFDFGEEKRQIIAGIAEVVKDPQELIGKQMPVLVNLEPKKIRGYLSEGMILAVDVKGRPVFLHSVQRVPNGSFVR